MAWRSLSRVLWDILSPSRKNSHHTHPWWILIWCCIWGMCRILLETPINYEVDVVRVADFIKWYHHSTCSLHPSMVCWYYCTDMSWRNFFLLVIVPMLRLYAKTHPLSHIKWEENHMFSAIDCVYKKLHKIKERPALILQHMFMIKCFSKLYIKLPELK